MIKNLILMIGLIFFYSCVNSQDKNKEMNQQQIKEALIAANKKAIEQETIQIDGYVKRRKWEMITTGTGLRYQIYQKGNGEKAVQGRTAVIKYELSLINGNVVYSTKDNEVEQFVIGKDHVESGLHEAICYLQVGDKAKIVIPSYLAHGLVGDFKKIPIRSTIIYDLELKDLK